MDDLVRRSLPRQAARRKPPLQHRPVRFDTDSYGDLPEIIAGSDPLDPESTVPSYSVHMPVSFND